MSVPSHVLPLGVHDADRIRTLPRMILFPPSESEGEHVSSYRHACYIALKEWVSFNLAPSEYETEHEARALARSRAQVELGRSLRASNEDVLLVAAVRDLVIARSSTQRAGRLFG